MQRIFVYADATSPSHSKQQPLVGRPLGGGVFQSAKWQFLENRCHQRDTSRTNIGKPQGPLRKLLFCC